MRLARRLDRFGWRCPCGARGEERTPHAARDAGLDHYARTHGEANR